MEWLGDHVIGLHQTMGQASGVGRDRGVLFCPASNSNGLFGSIFERKDPRRLFTPEQRRGIRHNSKSKVCAFCKTPVSWEDFTIDHVRPHLRGGRTTSINAALAHKSCNSRAGDKKVKRRT